MRLIIPPSLRRRRYRLLWFGLMISFAVDTDADLVDLLAYPHPDRSADCLRRGGTGGGLVGPYAFEVKKSVEMAEGLRAEMNRSLAMYYSNLGTIYATKNMTDEAEAEFRHALEVFPHDVLALFNLGRVYADKKKYMEAKEYYERLVEITPDDPIAWYNLASVYVELDNPLVSDYNTIDMGIQCYMRTLELEPTHLEASFKLMEIALNHKKSDLAIKVMESAVENNPDEPLAYDNLISVYDKCKMFEQAEEARKRLKERFAKKAKDGPRS